MEDEKIDRGGKQVSVIACVDPIARVEHQLLYWDTLLVAATME